MITYFFGKGSHARTIIAGLLLALLFPLFSAEAKHQPLKPLNNRTVISVGSELDYPPYAMVDENGQADGFSVDLIKAVAREMGLELKFEVGPWSVEKSRLERGEIDALPLVAYSTERDKYFDFSRVYIINHAVIFVRKGDLSDYQTHEDFRGKEVIIMRGDSSHEYIKSSHITNKIFETATVGDALKLLSSGKHDFVVAPKLSGRLLLKELGIDNIQTFGEPLEAYGRGYAFAVHEGDRELLEHLNQGLLLVHESGEYDRIYDRWFGDIDPKLQTIETLDRALIIVGSALVLFVFIGLLWNGMLRHQVAQKTAALRESEQRFRDVSDAAGEYVWEIDANMIYTYVSERSRDVKGYAPKALLGHTPMEFMPKEDVDPVGRIVNKAIADKAPFRLQHRDITPGGEIFWEEVSGKPFYDHAGNVIGLRGTGLNINARIKAEKTLRDSESTFREMAETLPLAIYVHSGEEQVCEYINPKFTELFGYTMEDVPTVADWWPLAYPDEKYRQQVSDDWHARVEKAIEKQSEIEPMETVVTAKDGSKKSISWGFNALGSRNYAFGLDVTERNKAEAQVLEDERRFRSLFESVSDYALVLEIEKDGPPVIINANKAAFTKHGYSRNEMIGQPITLIDHNTQPENITVLLEKIKGGQVARFEVTHTCKDGSTFEVETSNQLIKTNDKRTIYISIEHDITERKLAEAKVEKLSQAVIQSGEGLIIADADGLIEYVNPAFTEITGYSEDEVLGQNPSILKSGHQSTEFYAEMWNTLQSGNPWQGKVVNQKKNGEFYPAMLTISPIKNDDGEIINYISLQQSLEEYESLEAQFHQAQKMEAIGTLVGGIAHDFNNLLAGMTGNIYLARQQAKDNADIVEKLTTVETLSYRAADLIKQLLTFARKGLVDMRPLPLVPFLKETIKLLRSTIPENIELRYDISADSLSVNGDATQLHQILMNLVNNAQDAVEGKTNPGIHIKLEAIDADANFIASHSGFTSGAYAHLSVEDNGYGIAKERMEHLFEPFFTTKPQGKGTGLGLAMAYGAIQSHKGHIEVESSKGSGTCFHIYLPLLEEPGPAEPKQEPDFLVHGHGELILLADDDSHVRESVKDILESLEYEVMEASDGLQAVDLFIENSTKIALVISDIVMPRLSGTDAYERMRKHRPDIKIIFLTGYDRGAISVEKLPRDDHIILNKPYNIAELSHAIRVQLHSNQ